ncbi:hypothetical protein MJL48_34230, partial [Salmonella enterica subsp. enterica serovar Kentucky]|nr:hypothetical protein [Salmonella enterica subsp. enterica serovar Kentucky]
MRQLIEQHGFIQAGDNLLSAPVAARWQRKILDKSTFLRCINFLEKPSEGAIIVNGQNINLVRDKDGQLKVADKN